ncbi:MAG: OsmC family protein [Bacteroidales bacterium]|nr:OsmC family protein [Bacteroidales bacterium]MCF8403370.1 OsmC family protein [Bacteroidales bacterium]
MKNKVDIAWTENMAFEATVNDHKIMLDASPEVGGKNKGPRPKPLTLVSLGGCTGMDVVSILNKMRVQFDGLNIEVEGELSEEHPKVYHTITIIYHFKGKDLPIDKLEKAVNLSQERYCGVTAMLNKTARIEHKIVIN